MSSENWAQNWEKYGKAPCAHFSFYSFTKSRSAHEIHFNFRSSVEANFYGLMQLTGNSKQWLLIFNVVLTPLKGFSKKYKNI